MFVSIKKIQMKKLSKKQIREYAKEKAGPVQNWMTPDERKTYMNGIIDGITLHYQLCQSPKK